MINWDKKGLIYEPKKKFFWNKSHSMLPTILRMKKNILRIFFASRSRKNQSHISFIDYDFLKKKIIYEHKKPVMSPGDLGSFDDNGVVPSSVVRHGKKIYLYYIGWKPQSTTRYSLIAGLSISNNSGLSFKRYSRAPILNLSNREPFMILTAPSVIKQKGIWRMWYVSCEKWKKKDFPTYNIKYAFSRNGKNWIQTGKVCIRLKKQERAIARPCVLKIKNKFYMWYCYEKKVGTYKIGFAESNNGISWKRLDKKIDAINSFRQKWEKNMLAYPSLVKIKNKLFMFYNGNGYGKDGIALAKSTIKKI